LHTSLTLTGLLERHLDLYREVPDTRPPDGIPRSQRPPRVHFRLFEEHNGDPCHALEGEREPDLWPEQPSAVWRHRLAGCLRLQGDRGGVHPPRKSVPIPAGQELRRLAG